MEEIKNPEVAATEATAEETTPKKKSKKQDEIDALTQKLEELTKERDSLLASNKEQGEKYLRMAAEYDNFRRRSREEKEATYGSAMGDTVAELLPIIDNLERAAAFEDGEKVKEGLKMIYSSVSSVLEKLGIEVFGAVGDAFDPNIHNAIMHEEDDSGRENEITEVFQKGYRKGNRVIRFAMVKTVN